MKWIPYFIFLTLGFSQLLSAQQHYPVSAIDPALLRHANVVVRKYELKFEILNHGEALETEHKVLTLLNEKAAAENDPSFWYDQIQKIKSMEGLVYDASGKLVRRIKKSDIEDTKPFEFNFVNDNRLKTIHFPKLSYPYTLEYTVVTKHDGLLFYPVFQPQQSNSESVESAHFEIQAPDSLPVRFYQTNILPAQKTGPLCWDFKQLKAFEPEPFLPLGYQFLPRILTGPTRFRMEGYEGDMSTWQSFGRFIQTLQAEKMELPAEKVAYLQQLTADCPDPTCKARKIYELLQNSTRYYFVGLGIGGWQSMPAALVDKFKYSDCKGLSNYTVAMLRAVGVPAYYALIRATEKEQMSQTPEFPNAWFNHATLCIPLPSDTIWLECTSQQESFGFLGTFTDNRPALVIFPEGGEIVQTPVYDQSVNTIHRTLALQLNTDGSAALQATGMYKGIAQEIPAQLSELSDEWRKKYWYEHLSLTDFEIRSLSMERKKDRIPEVDIQMDLHISHLASGSGKRLFVPIPLLSNKISMPLPDTARVHPVQADSRGISVVDEIQMSIPEGYSLENAPKPLSVHSAFGDFEWSVQSSPGQVSIHRKLVLNASIQAKERYSEWLAFLQTVSKADQTRLVLVH